MICGGSGGGREAEIRTLEAELEGQLHCAARLGTPAARAMLGRAGRAADRLRRIGAESDSALCSSRQALRQLLAEEHEMEVHLRQLDARCNQPGSPPLASAGAGSPHSSGPTGSELRFAQLTKLVQELAAADARAADAVQAQQDPVLAGMLVDDFRRLCSDNPSARRARVGGGGSGGAGGGCPLERWWLLLRDAATDSDAAGGGWPPAQPSAPAGASAGFVLTDSPCYDGSFDGDELCFSTRRAGVCCRICVTRTGQADARAAFSISADLAVPRSALDGGVALLQSGEAHSSPAEYMLRHIWPHLASRARVPLSSSSPKPETEPAAEAESEPEPAPAPEPEPEPALRPVVGEAPAPAAAAVYVPVPVPWGPAENPFDPVPAPATKAVHKGFKGLLIDTEFVGGEAGPPPPEQAPPPVHPPDDLSPPSGAPPPTPTSPARTGGCLAIAGL